MMKEIQIPITDHASGWAVLRCAGCGSTYTHMEAVEVFWPQYETSRTGTHVRVGPSGYDGDASMEGNPSPEREGLRIRAWCEDCPAITVLDIYQHQGNNFLRAYGDGPNA